MSSELLDALEQLEMTFYEELLGKFNATDFTAVGVESGSLVTNEITVVGSEAKIHATTLEVCIDPLL
jgi:hypothetical protein